MTQAENTVCHTDSGCHSVPLESIPITVDSVFDEATVAEWRLRAPNSKNLSWRLEVLESMSTIGQKETPMGWHTRLRATRRAWGHYLASAQEAGLFAQGHSEDLLARLRSPDDENFRSALAECTSAWYLRDILGFALEARPSGRRGKELEFAATVDDLELHVEVKSPHRARPDSGSWSGDDSDSLKSAMKSAQRQFDDDVSNLLVVVPDLRTDVFDHRGQLVGAFFGETAFTWLIDTRTGQPTGDEGIVFKRDGHFLKKHSRDVAGKQVMSPGYTRIGAVLTIERFAGGDGLAHKALVVHNPMAARRLPEDIWLEAPQFVPRGEKMLWSDESDLFL